MNRSALLCFGHSCSRLRLYASSITASRVSQQFSSFVGSQLDQSMIRAVEEREYEKVAELSRLLDSNTTLSPLAMNAVMSAHRMIGSSFSIRPSVGDGVEVDDESALFMLLQQNCADNTIEGVEIVLLRLLEKFELLCPHDKATIELLRKVLGGDALNASRKRRRLAILDNSEMLPYAPVQDWISIKGSNNQMIEQQLFELRESLNKLEAEFSHARVLKYRALDEVSMASYHLRKCRKAEKAVREDHSVVDRLLTNELLPSAEDVAEQTEELQVLSEELAEYEAVLERAEHRHARTNQAFLKATEIRFRTETALQSLKNQYIAALAAAGSSASEVVSGTIPIHVLATFLRFYASRNSWLQCLSLLEIAELHHPLTDETRTNFTCMYHDLLQALSHSAQFEQVLATLTKMRSLSLPVELPVAVGLLTAFGTVTPSSTFTVQASNYPLLGKVLISLREEVVRCVVQAGDRVAHLKLTKLEKLPSKQYREIVSTQGYATTLNLVEMYLLQLVKLNQFQVAEQMVTFLHEQYPQFLTSKGLQPLLNAYKMQGRYDEVVKTYNLWSKSVFKRHQENALYNVVFETIRLQDGVNMNRSAKFLDSNNPKVEGL